MTHQAPKVQPITLCRLREGSSFSMFSRLHFGAEKADSSRIRLAARRALNERPLIPLNDWPIDPVDNYVVRALDEAWNRGLIGAKHGRLHPQDQVHVFSVAAEGLSLIDWFGSACEMIGVKDFDRALEIEKSWTGTTTVLSVVEWLAQQADPIYNGPIPRFSIESMKDQAGRDHNFAEVTRFLRRRRPCHLEEWGKDAERRAAAEVVALAIEEELRFLNRKHEPIVLRPDDAVVGPLYWFKDGLDVEFISIDIENGLGINLSKDTVTERWPTWEKSTIGQFVDDLLAIKRRAT
jgi:hypothetical protein